MKQISLVLVMAILPALMQAQTGGLAQKAPEYDFPQLHNKPVPGSPILSQPVIIQGATAALKTGGLGWSDPILFDWNNDGKKDLLVGEFMSRMSVADRKADPKLKGSHIRVYYNVGTNTVPKFTDDFVWAQDKTGAYLNVVTSCCIGFTPRVYDLNSDGFQDIITGSFPGHVTCYYGSKDGFEAPVNLEQKGMPTPAEMKLDTDVTNSESAMYWAYSSADFVDVDGDGLLDLITGGSALRVSRNVGTKTNPVFDKREMLLDTEGQMLTICKSSESWQLAGVYSSVPLIIDWDQDGVPDMLVTSDYTSKEQPAVSFFRGVRQNGILRFERPLSLFDAGDQSKQFPGSWLRTWVTDWNEDGINDLLIGTSVATVGQDEIEPFLSWEWEKNTEIKKQNPKYLPSGFAERMKTDFLKKLESSVKAGKLTPAEKDGYANKLLDMAHQGRVYLLLGTGIHKK